MPSTTTPTTAADAAATTGAYSDIPTEAPVPLPLFGSSPAVTAAVVLSAAAMLGAVCSAAFFVRRGFKRGFSPATIALAAINVLALTLEVFQTLFSNASHGNRVYYDWRNVWLPLSTLSLNLLQIEVAAVFQGSLIRLSWLTPDKLPIVRAAAIVVHFVCCWSSYLQAWLQNDTHSPVAQLLGNIMAAYELFIPLFGVALNGYIMFGIRRDIAPPLANGDERPMITATRRKRIRMLQALIAVVILLDLMVIGGYVMAMISDSQQVHTLEYYCFLEIAIAFFAMHMCAETVMYDQVLTIFYGTIPKEYIARVGISSWLGGGANDSSEASSVRALIDRDGTGSQSAVAGSSSIGSAAPSIVVQGSGDNSGEAVYSSRR
ncbi:hypothetical protein HK105_206554 [Polyrhizophydium stewartii]|uniref:Uncharacterized protein n=1 Tax=Polyrhizophydium stewartii TaxID=2732419 RepID=A0ABR4N379_9FUNG